MKAALTHKTPTELVFDIVSAIEAHDAFEKEQIVDTLTWIKSGASIFRVAKPDIPNKHLVSYFVLFDSTAQKMLLVDHKKAQLWLPPGGHIEPDEDPKDTVRRECLEELGVQADFWSPDPIFLTSTLTVGLTAGHTDVSLWYVIKGSHKISYQFDADEFNGIKWFDLDQIPYQKSDPHMQRFISKFRSML